MARDSRRRFLIGAGAVVSIANAPFVHAQKRGGTIRIIPIADLKVHDGQAVTAEDCVVSLQRWGQKDSLGKLLLAATGKLAASDKKTFTLDLKEPFGAVLDALGKPSSNVPFIMPARLATTDANEQIKEIIGSGPYRFVKAEWQPGDQVVYERFADYAPRNEAP